MRRLAVLVECEDEYCGNCGYVELKRDGMGRTCLWCAFFKKELSPSYSHSIAERCAACHLAERCAKGESLYD